MSINKIKFGDINLRYSDIGKGEVVVLLHGYLESLEIWDSFALKLSEKYRIICIDFPGHGKSGVKGDVHTMEYLADSIYTVMQHIKINSATFIGHSMGGYATLALLNKYPALVKRYSLFHSHPFPDTDTTRKNRDREMSLINAGKKDLIFEINIPHEFATSNRETFIDAIEMARDIAKDSPNNGIFALLNGMKVRFSHKETMLNNTIPFLFILGKDDSYIPFDWAYKLMPRPSNTTELILENSGHIGFIEEEEISLNAITEWISKN